MTSHVSEGGCQRVQCLNGGSCVMDERQRETCRCVFASCMYSESLRTSIYDPAATRAGVNRTINTVAPKRIWNLLCTVNVKHSV